MVAENEHYRFQRFADGIAQMFMPLAEQPEILASIIFQKFLS